MYTNHPPQITKRSSRLTGTQTLLQPQPAASTHPQATNLSIQWPSTARPQAAGRLVGAGHADVSQLAGFAKRDDLRYFTNSICNIEYHHRVDLAPTADILDPYKKKESDWSLYETQFRNLITTRKIESTLAPELIENSCLLCSEEQPHQCHRRLVAEYLQQHWPAVQIEHLG